MSNDRARNAIDRREKIAGRIPLAPIAPEPRHARRRAQFPGLCLLGPGNCERPLEIRFRFCRIRFGRLERDLAGNAINLSLPPPFLGSFHCNYRFTNAAPGIIELAKVDAPTPSSNQFQA
jgi:hypothetical protein